MSQISLIRLNRAGAGAEEGAGQREGAAGAEDSLAHSRKNFVVEKRGGEEGGADAAERAVL